MSSLTYKKTRFVCVSDTHGSSPKGAFKLPKGDVLIHAGDMTKTGTYKELRKTLDWIESADFEAKIVIAGKLAALREVSSPQRSRQLIITGNHDITLDKEFHSGHGPHFPGHHLESPDTCIKMFKESGATYLNHEAKTIRLIKEDGPKTSFKIFGSPFSPVKGLWAFGYQAEAAIALWEQIPLDADVVVTHTPAKGHCDKTGSLSSAGCDVLRQALLRVRPRLAVCGHIHEGRGAERLIWETPSSKFQHQWCTMGQWIDPAADSHKQSFVNLTSKTPELLQCNVANEGDWNWQPHEIERETNPSPPTSKGETKAPFPVPRPISPTSSFRGSYQSRSNGHEDNSPSVDDVVKRPETCIINAAIMASSWPYRKSGDGRYNKPIVVDVDLPVWESPI